MERGSNPEILTIDGKLYGFNLGADFTCEHECGIDGIKYMFGIDQELEKNKPLLGADKRTTTKFPENYVNLFDLKIKNKKYWALICSRNYNKDNKFDINTLKHCNIYPYYEEEHIFSAWDDRSFGILVDKEYQNELKELYEGLKNCNVLFGLGKGHAFKNGGLLLIIRSSLSQEESDSMYQMDLDYINLEKAVEESGIREILKAAGKGYYALSPRWADESKTNIRFWLNPEKQQLYDSGWYTIEELKLWAEDSPLSVIIKANKIQKKQ